MKEARKEESVVKEGYCGREVGYTWKKRASRERNVGKKKEERGSLRGGCFIEKVLLFPGKLLSTYRTTLYVTFT